MKKFYIIAFAALLVAVFTLPAAAVEHEFGGYWRTRFTMNRDFSGSSSGDLDGNLVAYDERNDASWVDTRSRLYYTAVLNDNLKFVNKFEFDGIWGEGDYGDIGADGNGTLEIKNSYADIMFGIANAHVGVQGKTIARGFFFADDFSGFTLNFGMDTIKIPLYWIRVDEGLNGKDANDGDADMFGVAPTFSFGGASINPMLFYLTTKDVSKTDNFTGGLSDADLATDIADDFKKLDIIYLGLNADVTFGPANVWFTGIYEGGSAESQNDNVEDVDLSAFLVALGGGASFGMFEAHGQVFYATGDDGSNADEYNAFVGPPGQSYYWSEIMGYGTFDEQKSSGSPGDKISDILAIGIGGSISPMEKLSLGLDIWYAQLAEDKDGDFDVDEKLGTEVDFTVKYGLMEDLDLTVVAAYLMADDGTDATGDNEDTANPFELGAQISLSF